MSNRLMTVAHMLILVLFAAGLQNAAPAHATEFGTVAARSAPDDFLHQLTRHCGKAFAGRIERNEPLAIKDPFANQPLIMHLRVCRPDRIEIPFHVGDDHSRTWVLTRNADRLRLKHDHRHADGSSDAVTMYGGDARTDGTAQRQIFPVDRESIAMFEREGLTASVTNVWAMEISAQQFAYELSRPGRMFRVVFDLNVSVDLPPAPWGHGDPPTNNPAQ